jgi:hypothetical protein
MRLARLDVTARGLATLPVFVSDDERPVVIRVTDADTVTMLAGVCDEWSGSWGVWLRASEDYSAGLIARDVKTLCTLLEVDHVVIDAAHDAAAHAEVVAALLSDEEVTLHNAVATITAAYNRPAPARAVSVWSVEGDEIRHGDTALRRGETRGAVTFFVTSTLHGRLERTGRD